MSSDRIDTLKHEIATQKTILAGNDRHCIAVPSWSLSGSNRPWTPPRVSRPRTMHASRSASTTYASSWSNG